MNKFRKHKFHRGDKVRIAKDLGASMDHFKKACPAIVIASYQDQYGPSAQGHKMYTLLMYDGYTSSWYYEHQLTFVRKVNESTILRVLNRRFRLKW